MSLWQRLSLISPGKPKFTESDLPDLTGKVLLITGAAGGIGKELARMVYSANATVYICGRNAENLDKAKADIIAAPTSGTKPSNGSLTPVVFDLSDLETIKPAVQDFLQKVSRIDAVVFNAGVCVPPEGSRTKQDLELQWGTNVVGHFLLQRLLTPLILSSAENPSAPVRVIWVSSDASDSSPSPDGIAWDNINSGLTQWGFYNQSKAGNMILGHETAARLGPKGIAVYSVNPGWINSDLSRHISVPEFVRKLIVAGVLHDSRHGALTELYSLFSKDLTMENNGAFIIPWGSIGLRSKHIQTGLDNGSGARLWGILEKETEAFA